MIDEWLNSMLQKFLSQKFLPGLCKKGFQGFNIESLHSLDVFFGDTLDVFASKKSYPESNPGKIYIKRNVM